MAQTTDEVVSNTPARWRVLGTEEAPALATEIPLVAHLATCCFLQHEIRCLSSDRCKLEHNKEIRTHCVVSW